MESLEIAAFKAKRARTKWDALTEVRNHVREQFPLHPDASSISIEVTWPKGGVEVLTFDRWVGYPVGTDAEKWLMEYEREARGY